MTFERIPFERNPCELEDIERIQEDIIITLKEADPKSNINKFIDQYILNLKSDLSQCSESRASQRIEIVSKVLNKLGLNEGTTQTVEEYLNQHTINIMRIPPL